MINLINLEKKINSELTTKVKKSEIKHDQLYLSIDSEDLMQVSLFIKNNDNLILDGDQGIVIINPDIKTQNYYLELQKNQARNKKTLSGILKKSSITLDKTKLR